MGWEYGRVGGNKEYIQNFGVETYGDIETNDFTMDLMEIGCGGGMDGRGSGSGLMTVFGTSLLQLRVLLTKCSFSVYSGIQTIGLNKQKRTQTFLSNENFS
jgi:hypothetical protein